MFSIKELFQRFIPIVRRDSNKSFAYIKVSDLTELYKTTKGNSRVNQNILIDRFNLNCLYLKRKTKHPDDIEVLNITSNEFKPQAMIACVDIQQLMQIKELVPLIKNMQKRVKADEDLVKQFESIKLPDEDNISGDNEYPLIELEDHEQFRDVNDNIVNIVVRGKRSPDGILLRAIDIQRFFGISQLVHMVLNDKTSSYIKTNHYIVIDELLDNHRNPTIAQKHSNKHISHDSVYLTWLGFHRVIFVSRSGNANVDHMAAWIMRLTYVHQVGSNKERVDLASTLISFKCLHKISGLYLIRIDKVSALRECMHINEETYPSSEYDSGYVYKFGRSDDIQKRVKDHQDDRRGYGRYSKNVSLHWFVNINETVLSKAESNLNEFFEMNGLKFEFIDDRGNEHKELVIIKSSQERALVKEKYLSIIKHFPSRENELIQMMTNARDQYEFELALRDEREARIRVEAELKISNMKSELKVRDERDKVRDEREERIKLDAKVAILELQLQIAHLQMNAN